jgi:RNA polymerase sigma factor (sigma-70 family)
MTDEELLHAYANEGSEAAFAELVRRHGGAVQAAAWRQTGNAQLAEEVTHAVFMQLARKAGSLRPSVFLLGWLLRAARYAAIDAVRAEDRRMRREAAFSSMHTLESTPDEQESESLWARVAPKLDEALLRLRATDRNALLLRFFQNKSLSAVGAALGIPEDAARKRVRRALERLQHQLLRSGASAPMAVLPGLLSSRAAPNPAAEAVSATVRRALAPPETSSGSVLLLTSALGRRLFIAGIRPWLAGAVAVAAVGVGMALPEALRPASMHQAETDDYRPAGFPDATVVRGFVERLQRNLAEGRREEVARMMRLPLRVNSPQGTEFIENQAAVLARFEVLFRPEVTGNILKSPTRRLFCSADGVMVGDGTLWIGPAGDRTRPEPKVIALNLP